MPCLCLPLVFSVPSVKNMPSFDEQSMARALDLARAAAAAGEVPVGAVVYETATGRILGEGANRRESAHDPLAHAELIAIAAACREIVDWRLNHCTLVVTLEPCPMCAGAIVNSRVGRLVFGAMDPKAGACGSLMRLTEDPRLNHRVTPITGLLEAECSQLLKDFFKRLRAE
ncbi:MAG: tRNA adenosine(34) deaminase TadA [Phycisphaerales bacterium]